MIAYTPAPPNATPVVLLPLTGKDVGTIASWRYPRPYHGYDIDGPQMLRDILNRDNHFMALTINDGLMGFCIYGPDGRVPGYDYDESAVDIGIGIRPDLTGKGNGTIYVGAVVTAVVTACAGRPLRVTIASWNRRSTKVWMANRFVASDSFVTTDGRPFDILIRPA